MEEEQQKIQQVSIVSVESNGLAVAALVLGIIGLVLVWVPFLSWVLGILSIIFGSIGLKKEVKTGMAKAGLILGVITIVVKIAFWVTLASSGGLISSILR